MPLTAKEKKTVAKIGYYNELTRRNPETIAKANETYTHIVGKCKRFNEIYKKYLETNNSRYRETLKRLESDIRMERSLLNGKAYIYLVSYRLYTNPDYRKYCKTCNIPLTVYDEPRLTHTF